MRNPLMDKDFLYELNQYQHKEIYAKVISLNFQEDPLEQIEGRVTGGSINIDGNSAVRRTCSLTLVAKDVNITDFYWGVSNKFTLEIGVKNDINPEYPEIIWFKQGIFVIASFNSSLTNNNYTISISGKDKMCLLNGDLGGSLHSSIDFGKMDTYKDQYSRVTIEDYTQYEANKYYVWDMKTGEYKISLQEYENGVQYYVKDILLEQEDLKLKDIIREAVHTYGKEMYHNIVINDLDDYGLELLEYRGDTPLYMLYNEDASIYDQMLDEKNAKNLTVNTIENGPKLLTECELNTAVDDLNTERDIFPLQIGVDENNKPIYKNYSVTKVEYGHASGYRTTDLIYAGELISSVGEALTSILDKIKNMLGAFEYFYDLDGKFIFQAKKVYANSSWNTLVSADKNTFARDAVEESPYSYSFEDVNLIQKFQNTPAINNVKNDYSVWGTRKGVDGAELPIHARFAIHKKPVYYKTFDGEVFTTEDLDAVVSLPNRDMLPNCLKEGFDGEWWNIFDWAERYKILTGEYPQGYVADYANRTCKLDLNKYFPPMNSNQKWNANRPLFLFDITPEGELAYTAHNPYYDYQKPSDTCGHKYQWFINNSTKNGWIAYIYDPKIPKGTNLLYKKVDWREIIYQMAKDYYQHNQEVDFYHNVMKNNMKMDGITSYYPTGETGYEMFYTDIQGFWRELYDPNPTLVYDSEGGKYVETKIYEKDENGNQLETYKVETIWNPYVEKETFTCDYFLPGDGDPENYSNTMQYWNKNVVNAPEVLNFWIDFYEGDDALQQYAIPIIGNRPKVVNNSKITSIYFRNIPQVIFVTQRQVEEYDRKTGYTYIQLNQSFENLFSISAQGKSAEEEVNELMNKFSYCSEGVSLTTIPVYYLEPNTLVYIHDDSTGINGKYQVNRVTIPLTFNGMMSITATKIIDPIY